MTDIDICKFMGESGGRFQEKDLESIFQYVDLMQDDDRIASIDENGETVAIFFFSICDDWTPFYRKLVWDYEGHHPTGKTVYVEKIIAKKLNRNLIRAIGKFITTKYPQVMTGVWHRQHEGGDKVVTILKTKENINVRS